MSGSGWLVLRGARGNNLQSLDAAIPVGLFTCVTGVSGSGKSTLVQDTLFPRLMVEVYGTRTTWPLNERTRWIGRRIDVQCRLGMSLKRREKDGWLLDRTKGSHRQFIHSKKPGMVTVSGHPSDDVHPKTLKSIWKQAGLEKE